MQQPAQQRAQQRQPASYEGTQPDTQQAAQPGRNKHATNGAIPEAEKLRVADGIARQLWRISYPTGTPMTVLFTPAATRAEVADVYRGAEIERVPDNIGQPEEFAQQRPRAPDAQRRRDRALAMLADEPSRLIAVIADAGSRAHVTVAVRDVAVGDLEIPADRYDGMALLKLMEAHS